MKTLSKWFSIAAAVLALGSGSALASDVSADRAALADRREAASQAAERSRPGPSAETSLGDACSRKDCCARATLDAGPRS